MPTKTNGKSVKNILSEVEHLTAKERVSFIQGLFHIPKVRREFDDVIFEEAATIKAIQKARKRIAQGKFVRLQDLNRELD